MPQARGLSARGEASGNSQASGAGTRGTRPYARLTVLVLTILVLVVLVGGGVGLPHRPPQTPP